MKQECRVTVLSMGERGHFVMRGRMFYTHRGIHER